jgi:ribosomal protein S18 acetylase RimI-like enzyme
VAAVDVRPANRSDIGPLAKTLGRAFFEDPMTTWMLPDEGARRKKLHRLFAMLTRYHHFAGGGVQLAPNGSSIGAAALWDPPGRWQSTPLEDLRAMPRMIWTFGRDSSRGKALDALMKKSHPEEPHWYLAVIGSDPTVRGQGYGQALMHSGLDRCDAAHAPAYLESSNPANVPYYERFGFEVTGEIVLPEGGPTMWPMWRRPR